MWFKMACINCKHIEDCGTVDKYLRECSQSSLLKELNSEKEECEDFSFIAISGEILRDKILKMIKLSKEKKEALKQHLK